MPNLKASKRLFHLCGRSSSNGDQIGYSNGDLDDHYEEIQKLVIEYGADPNIQHKNSTPLCEASRNGYDKIVEFLLTEGADIDKSDGNMCSALYLAASHGHLKTVKNLVEHGANVNMINRHGYTPLLSSVENSYIEIAKYLISQGADVNVRRPNTFGVEMTILTYVLFAVGNIPFATLFLEAGVRPHAFERPLNFMLLEFGPEFRDFVKKLIGAGFKYRCEEWIGYTKKKMIAGLVQVTEDEKNMIDFLEFESKNVSSLQRICRTLIRTHLSETRENLHLKTKISKLPLPEVIKNFIALEDLLLDS